MEPRCYLTVVLSTVYFKERCTKFFCAYTHNFKSNYNVMKRQCYLRFALSTVCDFICVVCLQCICNMCVVYVFRVCYICGLCVLYMCGGFVMYVWGIIHVRVGL